MLVPISNYFLGPHLGYIGFERETESSINSAILLSFWHPPLIRGKPYSDQAIRGYQ